MVDERLLERVQPLAARQSFDSNKRMAGIVMMTISSADGAAS